MSTQTETKTNSLVWFEIPANNVERAKSFYGALFGWKIEKLPGPMEYWHIDTGGDCKYDLSSAMYPRNRRERNF